MMEAIELVFQSKFPDASNKLESDKVNGYKWLEKESSIRYMTHVHNQHSQWFSRVLMFWINS